MTFVSKGMAQNLRKSHLCNVKCGKLYDGEQHVLVFLQVLWYANKCIETDLRIRLFSGQTNDFCIKRDGSKFGKIAPLRCKIWQALRWRATGLVFPKVLLYANKCIVTDFRIHLFSAQKNDFCIKRDGSKFGKSHLCNVKYAKL